MASRVQRNTLVYLKTGFYLKMAINMQV
jgi:hypothetical protein